MMFLGVLHTIFALVAELSLAGDDSSASHLVLREKWKANGMEWSSSSRNPPSGWSAESQLEVISSPRT